MSGIYGVSTNKNCAEVLIYGTDYHTHLGTQFGGVAVKGSTITRKIKDISSSQFKSKFAAEIPNLKGSMGIGVISADHVQPVLLNSRFGTFALCTNGRVNNITELATELYSKGISFTEMNDNNELNPTEIIGKLICLESDFVTGIERVFDKIVGACSILILNDEGILAVRDRYGNSPLVIGKRGREYAVTTETTALPNFGFQIVKYLAPGEIVQIGENGLVTKREGNPENDHVCSFLWIYTGFPASSYESINTEEVRERSGSFLAKRDKVKADLVAGVPDSGVAHAIGYAMESGIPYRRPLVKYTPGYGRSYTPPSQAERDLVATMKLIPIREIIQNNKIIICDDSIVRGTQLKNFTIAKLWNNGAKEIHVRIACPPLMFPCRFNVSTRTLKELAARRAIRALEGRDIEDVSEYLNESSPKYAAMVEWIRNDLGVTTLKYQRLEDMVQAIGLSKESLCTFCWTGKSKCSKTQTWNVGALEEQELEEDNVATQ
jgi:amidophosphoribosyltransferase